MRVLILFILFVLFIGASPINAQQKEKQCDIFQSYSPCNELEKSTHQLGTTLIIGERYECFCIKCLHNGRIVGQIIGRIGTHTYGNDIVSKIWQSTPDNIARYLYQSAIVDIQFGPKYIYSPGVAGNKQWYSFNQQLSNMQANNLLNSTPKYGFQINRAASESFEGRMLGERLTPENYRVRRVAVNEGNPETLFKRDPILGMAKDAKCSNKLIPQSVSSPCEGPCEVYSSMNIVKRFMFVDIEADILESYFSDEDCDLLSRSEREKTIDAIGYYRSFKELTMDACIPGFRFARPVMKKTVEYRDKALNCLEERVKNCQDDLRPLYIMVP